MNSQTKSVQMLAQRVARVFETDGEEVAITLLFEIGRERGQEVMFAVLDEWRRRQKSVAEEARAEYEESKRQFEIAQYLFEGLPKDTTVLEACQIKAARGDALAQQYLDYFNSHEFRLASALIEAAFELHPGWRKEGRGMVRVESNAPTPGDGDGGELVEWLCKHHPDVAKGVEQEIE